MERAVVTREAPVVCSLRPLRMSSCLQPRLRACRVALNINYPAGDKQVPLNGKGTQGFLVSFPRALCMQLPEFGELLERLGVRQGIPIGDGFTFDYVSHRYFHLLPV